MKKYLGKFSILLSCILLTVISITVAISSKDLLFTYKLPVRNFVTLSAVISYLSDCEPHDTGYRTEECGDYEIHNSRASAAAIDSVDGVTYFLTAAHFCEVQEALDISQQMFQGNTGYRFEIIKDGERIPFEILKYNKSNDLCMISSEEYDIDAGLIVSDDMPEVGETVRSISSPLGIAENGVNFHFSGIFSGCNAFMCFFTVPAISGSSGSLILNQDDEVVGMTQRSLIGFPEVAIGVGNDDIVKFIREFESDFGIELSY